jgi:hypothetical protein
MFSRAVVNAPDNHWFGEYYENRHTKMVQMIHYGHTLTSTAFGSDGAKVSVELMTFGPDRINCYDVRIHNLSITAILPDGRQFGKTFEVRYLRGMLNGVAWPDRFLDFEIQKFITDVRKSEISETVKPLVIHALEAWVK